MSQPLPQPPTAPQASPMPPEQMPSQPSPVEAALAMAQSQSMSKRVAAMQHAKQNGMKGA